MKTIISMSENDNFTILANTKWLLNNSMKDNMNAADIIIKIIAIENYYGKNDYGMNMYNKMQRIRVAKNKFIEREKAENEGKFIKLIKNYEENGYDKKIPVELNKNFEVFECSYKQPPTSHSSRSGRAPRPKSFSACTTRHSGRYTT